MRTVRLQCSNCGRSEDVPYTGDDVSEAADRWSRYGSALYCEKCAETWADRNGTERRLLDGAETMALIMDIYERQHGRRNSR